ncbi:hypothetical protein BDQ94DRAFT_106095 [Aspergillus welwitschiae]|uniref:Uncharacterized protein n=1 Tax=Aspergillus welwitschiae TaxID=1341132 RepID=A0A3F3QD63_9EURO|nr:hypothetical protein BDQ94DRAFT_106095 [Aspergillus welwitschiae]RDH37161.1 hypothetical protein BDQ94DRAFT_106095 [Aspergillus welwitschiae]
MEAGGRSTSSSTLRTATVNTSCRGDHVSVERWFVRTKQLRVSEQNFNLVQRVDRPRKSTKEWITAIRLSFIHSPRVMQYSTVPHKMSIFASNRCARDRRTRRENHHFV